MIEKLLNLVFRYVDILSEGKLYLRRWFIWPLRPDNNKLVPRVYLHKFYKGDNGRDLHDHPWEFSSLILKGGYFEHSFNPEWKRWKVDLDRSVNGEFAAGSYSYLVANEPEKVIKKWYGSFSFLRRGARWTHAVELPKKLNEEALEFGLRIETDEDIPCWTIVRTGIKERSWGFHTDNGWCWWKNYKNGICWCYDNPNEDLTNGAPSSVIEAEEKHIGNR